MSFAFLALLLPILTGTESSPPDSVPILAPVTRPSSIGAVENLLDVDVSVQDNAESEEEEPAWFSCSQPYRLDEHSTPVRFEVCPLRPATRDRLHPPRSPPHVYSALRTRI